MQDKLNQFTALKIKEAKLAAQLSALKDEIMAEMPDKGQIGSTKHGSVMVEQKTIWGYSDEFKAEIKLLEARQQRNGLATPNTISYLKFLAKK